MPSPSKDESYSPEREHYPPYDVFAPVWKCTGLVVRPIGLKGGPCDSSNYRIEGKDKDVVSYEAEGKVYKYFECRHYECVEDLLGWHNLVRCTMRLGYGGDHFVDTLSTVVWGNIRYSV